MAKKRVNLSLDKNVYRLFQKYCEENGMVISKKVELYMREELRNKRILRGNIKRRG